MENTLALAAAPPAHRLANLRRALATAAALGAAAAFATTVGDWPNAIMLPLALLVASAALVWRRDLGGQLLVRAIWWSNLLLGTLIAVSTTLLRERILGGGLCAGTGLALLVLGRVGVDDADRTGGFVPVALRGTLTAALVMALADAQTLLLFGGVAIHAQGESEIGLLTGWLLLAGGALLAIAGWGLFRLRGWSVLANIAGNLLLVAVALGNVGGLPLPLRLGWGATAAIQLLLMARLLVALRVGAAASPRRLPTSTTRLSALVVLALLLTGTICAVFEIRLLGVH